MNRFRSLYLILPLIIHGTFLFSIFDIYFKSPIINKITPYEPNFEGVADRLVLFMVDGLRAESFLNHSTMPHLRSIANSHGRWGISHTRVPTESRPGHVAVIAGFYEDPSAVAKGWKENPVDFDSVFNQTTYTWCWGTYDILEIFTKGSKDDHIYIDKFDPYGHTFSTDKNTTLLDDWVFKNVKMFLSNAKTDDNFKQKLNAKKVILFLHLLGTDTSGHTHKPKSENFLTTIRFVDEKIKEIESMINSFYDNDGKTTFLMTSDHGMTDWGSHGAGDNHETETPYVLWGAGVPKITKKDLDPLTLQMSLNHRWDIVQADLAPLMSTILGIPVPVNSIGKLPVDLLDLTLPQKAKALYSNARQLAHQYNKKRVDVEENAIAMLYKPFDKLNENKYNEIIQKTEKFLLNEDYEKLFKYSIDIMTLSLEGLTYYHKYYQDFLLTLVTLSFLGWIICLLKVLLDQNNKTDISSNNNKVYNITKSLFFLYSCFNILAFFLVYVQHLPLQYYVYFFLCSTLWYYVFSSTEFWMNKLRQLHTRRSFYSILIEVIFYVIGCVAMGLSFTHRWMLSIPLLGMGFWPLFSTEKKLVPIHVLTIWITSCILLSLFSFMPVVGKNVFIELVLISGIVWLVTMAVFLKYILSPLCKNKEESKREITLTMIQMVIFVLSLHNIYMQSKRFERATPVSSFYQTCSWIYSGLSLVFPLLHSKRICLRLLSAYTSILNFFLLLSVSHESLFIVTLLFNTTCWIIIEYKVLGSKNKEIIDYTFSEDDNNEDRLNLISSERSISSNDFRRSFFFLLYIILAFFGTGNIASLNSFEVRWVTCFITSFHPFVITTLVLLKTLSPFLCVGCSFRAVQLLTKAPPGYLNIIVLIFSNIMGMQLLFNVKNTGSWLEIGTSISQFVIVQVITLFIIIINQLTKFLTDVSIYSITSNMFKTRKKNI